MRRERGGGRGAPRQGDMKQDLLSRSLGTSAGGIEGKGACARKRTEKLHEKTKGGERLDFKELHVPNPNPSQPQESFRFSSPQTISSAKNRRLSDNWDSGATLWPLLKLSTQAGQSPYVQGSEGAKPTLFQHSWSSASSSSSFLSHLLSTDCIPGSVLSPF